MKRLLYIFIPFLAILLMSHNADALSLNIPVTRKASYTPAYYQLLRGNTSTSWGIGAVNNTGTTANVTGLRIRSNNNTNVTVDAGDYVEIFTTITFTGSYNADVSSDSDYYTLTNVSGYFQSASGLAHNCEIINFRYDNPEVYWVDEDMREIKYLVTITCLQTERTTTSILTNLYMKSNIYNVSWANINFGVTGMSIYTPTGSDADREEEATQEASDESEQAGDDSSSDAEDASSSLISAIGGFVNAITSASPSNCNIDADMGNMDLGTVDLCANPVPTFVQIISSLVLIAICIPFAIIMFNRFIGMFRSFQG